MDRISVWSVKDRQWFAGLSIAFCAVGLVLWHQDTRGIGGLFDIVTRVGNIILFSVAASFMVLEVVDMVLGIYESIKQRNYQRGFEEGKRAALKEQQDSADKSQNKNAETNTQGHKTSKQ